MSADRTESAASRPAGPVLWLKARQVPVPAAFRASVSPVLIRFLIRRAAASERR